MSRSPYKGMSRSPYKGMSRSPYTKVSNFPYKKYLELLTDKPLVFWYNYLYDLWAPFRGRP
jgi:hypothetical protein